MKRQFLGDSYDAVKRFWAQALAPLAPVLAHPRFIPDDLRPDFTRLTGISIAEPPVSTMHILINDPNTGVRTEPEPPRCRSRSHVSLSVIAEQLKQPELFCTITFDQSFRRGASPAVDQRRTKLDCARELGLAAFYYCSHAPFLFAAADEPRLARVRRQLIEAGMPVSRFETADAR